MSASCSVVRSSVGILTTLTSRSRVSALRWSTRSWQSSRRLGPTTTERRSVTFKKAFCMIGRPPRPIAERFWEKVIRQSARDCWLWNASTFHSGYGRFTVNNRSVGAHRVSWELTNGPVPDDMCVLHSCDNPRCVNPAHLFIGTHGDNSHDRDRKGRTARGERIWNSKLTRYDVALIRASTSTAEKIARRFGIHKSLVWKIKHRELWRHV